MRTFEGFMLNISEVLLSRSMRDRLLLLVLLVIHLCIGFAFDFSVISVSGLPGGGSGPVEVQVLLPVRILQEVQGGAARSVNLPGEKKGVLTMVEAFKHILPFFRWIKHPSTSQPHS